MNETKHSVRKRFWRWLVWLVPIAVLLQAAVVRQGVVLGFPALPYELGPADSDIWLRLAQVRQFINGDFFDHTVRNTNAPGGGVSIHWTRPMDFLLSLFYFLTPAGLADTTRLLLASVWLPPVLGLACFGVLMKAVRRRFNNVHALWMLVLLLAANPLFPYFTPGESDHHGLLALLWCGVICLLMRPLTTGGAWIAGALSGLMIWVSTEGLMLYALTLGILGLAALRRPEEMRRFFYVTLSAAIVAAAGLAVEVPFAEIFRFQMNDTLSIVYVMLLALIAAGTCLLSCPVITRLSFPRRVFWAAMAGLGALGIEIILFPRVVQGPLAGADPFITHEFFARVMESKPLSAQSWVVILQHIWQPALTLILICATWRRKLRASRKRQMLTLAVMLAGTFAMTLAQGRWTYYLQPPALVALATILPVWSRAATRRWGRKIERVLRPYLALLAAGVIVMAIGAPFDYTPDQNLWNCQAQLRYVIQTQQLQKLLGDAPRILYVPPEAGGDVLFFTPYRIIAGEYHREGKGLKALAEIEAAEKPEAAKIFLARRKVDSLLACPIFQKPPSWMHGLSPQQHPAWLTPVPGLTFMKLPGPKPVLFTVK
ncbi:MAG: hypothetical protein ACAH83_19515 [Alphaproteobacteria bacterium]